MTLPGLHKTPPIALQPEALTNKPSQKNYNKPGELLMGVDKISKDDLAKEGSSLLAAQSQGGERETIDICLRL